MNQYFEPIPSLEDLQARTAKTVSGRIKLCDPTQEKLAEGFVPEPKETIPWEEIEVTTYSNASPFVDMRLLHLPTGWFVEGKNNYRTILRRLLYQELCKLVEQERANER